jgi:hypothetical protein
MSPVFEGVKVLSAMEISDPDDMTKTQEFLDWFGTSKATDADGNPLAVYHGTSAKTKTFTKHNSNYGKVGHWFHTQPDGIAGYFEAENTRNLATIVQCYLSIRNPKIFGDIGTFKSDVDGKYGVSVSMRAGRFRKDLKRDGYDGVWIRNEVRTGGKLTDSWIAFDNSQIRITNTDRRNIRTRESYSPSAAEASIKSGPEESNVTQISDRYEPDHKDSRELVLREIDARRGQAAFRDTLLERYGRCLISGCSVAEVLEAAHIDPYRGSEQHHPDNGLILRADLHTLFDLNLVAIEPNNLIVRIHPALTEYKEFDGKPLKCLNPRPDSNALQRRWQEFKVFEVEC